MAVAYDTVSGSCTLVEASGCLGLVGNLSLLYLVGALLDDGDGGVGRPVGMADPGGGGLNGASVCVRTGEGAPRPAGCRVRKFSGRPDRAWLLGADATAYWRCRRFLQWRRLLYFGGRNDDCVALWPSRWDG